MVIHKKNLKKCEEQTNEAERLEEQSVFFIRKKNNQVTITKSFFDFPFDDNELFEIDKFFRNVGTIEEKKITLLIDWKFIKEAEKDRYVFANFSLIFFYNGDIKELCFFSNYDQKIANLINKKITKNHMKQMTKHFCEKTLRKTQKTLASKQNIKEFIHIMENSPTKENIEIWLAEQEKKINKL